MKRKTNRSAPRSDAVATKDRGRATSVDRLRFDTLVSDVASRLVGLPAETIDQEISNQLRTILEFADVDRCSIWLFSDKRQELRLHDDCSTLPPKKEAGGIRLAQCTAYAAQLRHGDTIALERLSRDLPETAATERQCCRDSGLVAHLGLPLVCRQTVIGVLTLESYTTPRSWTPEFQAQLGRIGDLFARILLQKKADVTLKGLFQFEKILSEISSVFSSLPASDIDAHIAYGLERIGNFLKADRSNYTHGFTTKQFSGRIYSWQNEGIAPFPEFDDLEAMFPWSKSRILYGKIIHFSHFEDLPAAAATDIETWRRLGTRSHVNVPISIGGPIVGALSVSAVNTHRTWPKEIVTRLRLVGEVFANALVRKKKELEVTRAFVEIKALKSQIEADCTYLKEEIELKYDHHHMIGQSDSFKSMIFKIDQIAATNTTVLISGETGTGKEMVARAIHANSQRKNRPMVKVNCASLSSSLIESELFGHEKGSFTGSHGKRIGRFELANGNTLFLDEIGELPIESQAKLLRVLQEGEFERLGSSETIKVDVRIIAATNRMLEDEVKKGRFRADLWYRVNIFPIDIPPLRERKEDIPLLAEWFTQKFSKKSGKHIQTISSNVMKSLQHYRWPGNVRELENVIERAVINTQGSALQLLGPLSNGKEVCASTEQKLTLAEMEKDYITQVLEETRWRVEGPKGAALILGLHPSTLRSRMRKLEIH